jgi:hypothetical protein
MPVVQLVPRTPSRLLVVTALAAAGAIAWKVAHRAPRSGAQYSCPGPVMLEPPAQQFAVPPPGDPYPRPDLQPPADKRYFTVDAVLVAEPRSIGGCGDMLVDTQMLFHPVHSNGGDLRVLVPCAEMPRAMFSKDAGNAGAVQLNGEYKLFLVPATDVPDGKNDTLWRAARIDEAFAPQPVD